MGQKPTQGSENCPIRPASTRNYGTVSSQEKEIKKGKMSPRKLRIMASLMYGNFSLGCCYSLMAPFFPDEAQATMTLNVFAEDGGPTAVATPPESPKNGSCGKADGSEKKEKALSPRKIKILASVVYGNLFLGSCYSLMAPFFPAEAERKGATATEYGFIFGIYQLVMFMASPIHGKLVSVLLPGFLLKAGMLTSGICAILFGLLIYAPPGMTFVSLAFVIRIVDAVGASAFLTASYTVLGCEFSDIIGRAMSIAETAFSVGLAIGPVLGGFLYDLGGFGTPFYVIGVLLFTGTAVNFVLFANMEASGDEKPGSAKKILSDFDFCLDAFAIIVCFASLGFNEATLEPHIRQFDLSPKAIGGIFLIEGLVDALTAFIWGFFSERVSNAQYITMIAICMFVACFLIIGPAPFLYFPAMLWVIILSQVFLGCGMAGEIVCSFTHGMTNAVKRGFPEDAGTYGMVSGILFSSACLGGFAGPSVAGLLMDTVGYQYATLFILAAQAFLAVLMGGRLAWLATRRRPPDNLQKTTETAGKLPQKSSDKEETTRI